MAYETMIGISLSVTPFRASIRVSRGVGVTRQSMSCYSAGLLGKLIVHFGLEARNLVQVYIEWPLSTMLMDAQRVWSLKPTLGYLRAKRYKMCLLFR